MYPIIGVFMLSWSVCIYTFTFMHLADAFIQSDLHCIQATVLHFYQLLLSLGTEPMILALLAPCSTFELQERNFMSSVAFKSLWFEQGGDVPLIKKKISAQVF